VVEAAPIRVGPKERLRPLLEQLQAAQDDVTARDDAAL
jgi:hypothetical protein